MSSSPNILPGNMPSLNIFDRFSAQINIVFSNDDKKLNELVSAFNRYGASFSLLQFGKLMNVSLISGEAEFLRGVLANIVHNYLHHKEDYLNDLKTTKLDKNMSQKLQNFITNLDRKGINGLSLIYEIKRSEKDDLIDATSDNLLQEVTDEDQKFVCYSPLVEINLTFMNHRNIKKDYSVTLTMEKLYNLIELLKVIYNDSLDSSMKYKKTLGESIIIPESE